MHEWLQQLTEFWNGLHTGVINDLGPWTYVALAILVATEGPLSTLLGAAAAATDLLDVRLVLLATIVGNILGDVVWYGFGYLHKLDTLFHYGKWLGVRRSHLDRLEEQMHAHATKMIVIAKLAYGLIVPTLVAAGLARVPLRKWFPMVFLVETLWSVLLVYVGYHMTGFIAELERGLGILVGAVWVAIFIGVFSWLKRRKRRIEGVDDASVDVTEVPERTFDASAASNGVMATTGIVPPVVTTRVNGVNEPDGYAYVGETGMSHQVPDDGQDDVRGAPVGEMGGSERSA